MVSEARKRANLKWDKANTRQVKVKLNIKYDADILAKWDSLDNKASYFKNLVRADIAKNK